MSDGSVKIRIQTEAQLQSAQEAKAFLENLTAQVGQADAATAKYDQTIRQLDEAIKNNQIGLGKQAQALAEQIRNLQSLGVNTDALKAKFADMAKELAQPQQGDGIFGKMRQDLQELTREVPALSRLIGKTFEISTGSIGLFAAALGTAYEGIMKFAQTEVIFAKLDTALARSGHAADGTRESYEKLIRSLADETPQTTETQWANVILRLTQFQRTSQQIQGDVQVIRNLAGVMGSLSTAAMAFERASNGSFYAMRRYGIMIPDHVSQLEKMNTLTREAAEIGGGQLAAVQQTLIGQWDEMTTRVGTLVEAIGSRLTPITDALKFTFHELGGAAKYWSDMIRQSVPVLDEAGTAINHTQKSMGDMRQEMQTYAAAWAHVKEEIDFVTTALKAHDDQLEKSQTAREKFSKWQEERDVAEIERTVADPAERQSRIALRRGKTAEDMAAARDSLTGREIQEQQNEVSKNQRNIAGLDSSMQAVMASNISEDEKDNEKKMWAQRRGVYIQKIIEAENKIGELADKRKMDAAEAINTISETKRKSLEDGIKSASEESKGQLQNRLTPELSPDNLATIGGQRMIAQMNQPSNAWNGGATDQILFKAGGGQLDEFAKYIEANGGSNTYRYLAARIAHAQTVNKLAQANIDLYEAQASNNTKEEAEIRAKIESIKFDAYNKYTDDIAKYEQERTAKGGRGNNTPEPIAPDANIFANGRVWGKSGYPSFAPPASLQNLFNQYQSAQFNRPSIALPLPTSTPQDVHNADFFPTPNWASQAPPGFDPQTMIMMTSRKDGQTYYFRRNADGTVNSNAVLNEQDVASGHPGAGIPAPMGGDDGSQSSSSSFGGAGFGGAAPGQETGQAGYAPGGQGGGHQGWQQKFDQNNPVLAPMLTTAASIAATLLIRKLGGKGMKAVMGSRLNPWRGVMPGVVRDTVQGDAIAGAATVHTELQGAGVGKTAEEIVAAGSYSNSETEVSLNEEYAPQFDEINSRSAAIRNSRSVNTPGISESKMSILRDKIFDNLRGSNEFSSADMDGLDSHLKHILGRGSMGWKELEQRGVISVERLPGGRFKVSVGTNKSSPPSFKQGELTESETAGFESERAGIRAKINERLLSQQSGGKPVVPEARPGESFIARETEKQAAKAGQAVSEFSWDGSSLPENFASADSATVKAAQAAAKLRMSPANARLLNTLGKIGGAASKFNTSTGEILGKIPGLNAGVGIGQKLGGAGVMNIVDIASRYLGSGSVGQAREQGNVVDDVGQGLLESSESMLMEHPDTTGSVGHRAWSNMKDKVGILLHGMTLTGMSDMLPSWLGGNRDGAASVIESQGGVDRLQQALELQKRSKQFKIQKALDDAPEKTEFTSATHVSASSRAEDVLRDVSALSDRDVSKMSKENQSELGSAYLAVHGKSAGSNEDLREFADGLKDPKNRSEAFQKLYGAYRKAGLASFDTQDVSHSKDVHPADKKKTEDIPGKIDGYLAENMKVLTTVADKFGWATKLLGTIEKRLATVESRP